ncbi:MAG TPA: hypothetical protein VJ846_11725 [Sphingomicrobium sp.]|nr:hypothetical protein [Sphingomicrobium sp.]
MPGLLDPSYTLFGQPKKPKPSGPYDAAIRGLLYGPVPGSPVPPRVDPWSMSSIARYTPNPPSVPSPPVAAQGGPGVPPQQQPDPYTAENLSLGANAVYRDAIASAAQRTHRRPQILAAIVNREAHRRADGVWDPNSRNGDHLGLGEFDPGTWIGEAERHGTYLNGIAGRLGYLDPHGRVRPEHRAELLDLRTDPTNSINATADYTEQNLAQLRRDGFTITPETEAAYAYYAHQNGLRGAEDLLRGRRHANKRTFRGNVPAADQDRYLRRYPPRGPEFGSPYSAYLRDHLVDAAELDQFTTHPTRPNPPPRLPAAPRR